MHSLSENTLNELKKSGVKTEFLNTLALYLDSYPDFHGAFLKQLDEVNGNCFEFVQRYWKIPAHYLVVAFFHDLKMKNLEMETLGEEENSSTIAAWIRNIAPEFSKLEFTNPDSTLNLCYQFYDQILAILEESERKKSLVDIGMDQEQYMKLILGDPKLHGKGKDNKLEIGSAQSIEELYTQLHQHFEDHKPDPLRDDFYQFFGEVEKYDENPVRIQNHQIYQEIGETSSWDDMLDIISTYEKGTARD